MRPSPALTLVLLTLSTSLTLPASAKNWIDFGEPDETIQADPHVIIKLKGSSMGLPLCFNIPGRDVETWKLYTIEHNAAAEEAEDDLDVDAAVQIGSDNLDAFSLEATFIPTPVKNSSETSSRSFIGRLEFLLNEGLLTLSISPSGIKVTDDYANDEQTIQWPKTSDERVVFELIDRDITVRNEHVDVISISHGTDRYLVSRSGRKYKDGSELKLIQYLGVSVFHSKAQKLGGVVGEFSSAYASLSLQNGHQILTVNEHSIDVEAHTVYDPFLLRQTQCWLVKYPVKLLSRQPLSQYLLRD